jgi:high-affinity iron transporter
MGSWFEVYPYWETIGAQVLAAVLVVGSYYLAEELKVRRPKRRGMEPSAVKSDQPWPVELPAA